MSLETSTDVEEIRKVQDGQGNDQPPANATEQQAANERLGNHANGNDFAATDDTTGGFLPSHSVAPGCEVVVQAKGGNGSTLLVGLTSSPVVELGAGSSISYRVEDTSQIYIVAGTSGEGVNVTHEQV